jgi:AcrR family transcriptional regulator
MTDPAARPLRKDAEANRARLLRAAAELFAEQGLQVTLNDIAHHAGVGVGTAYRRFANKEEVIDALFEQRLNEVAAIGERALAEPDPWRGLVTYLEQVLQLQMEDRGLTGIINHPSLGQHRVIEANERIGPVLDQLIERARQHGSLRAGLAGTDIVFLQLALDAVMDATRGVTPGLYRRYLAIFLDGIRAETTGSAPLPVPAPNAEQTQQILSPSRKPARAAHS